MAGGAMPELSPAVPEEAIGEVEPRPGVREEDDLEEVGRPEGPPDERYEGPFDAGTLAVPVAGETDWEEEPPVEEEEPPVEEEEPPVEEEEPPLEEEEPPLEEEEPPLEEEARDWPAAPASETRDAEPEDGESSPPVEDTGRDDERRSPDGLSTPPQFGRRRQRRR
jgi:hypothetical protein